MDTDPYRQGGELRTIRVMIVDDHPVVRYGYRFLLEDTGSIQVVAEAETGEEGYEAYKQHLPDVVIMDLILPGAGGLTAIRRIRQRNPGARVLALSRQENPLYVRKSREAGAIGFISKSASAGDLIEAVRRASLGQGSFTLSQDSTLPYLSDEQEKIQQLTSREFEVFQLLAQGLPVFDIAQAL
ncbi:MAG: response regulator transcription factor, partial [Pseudomonadales bacterium]|nr:response regulator transcription factor [Pseudomonadales bacterium]